MASATPAIGSGVFRFSHKQLEESGGVPIPFRKRWDNEGDWELFGHITATPIRRPESKCCEELKRLLKELEKKLAEQGKRIDRLENPKPPKGRLVAKAPPYVSFTRSGGSGGPVVK